jgi:V/A-type H+-transporting ATPase subunit K
MKRVLVLVVLAGSLSLGMAQELPGEAVGPTVGDGLIALAAALAISLSAVGVGIAMGAIGSAAVGTLAERPQAFGQLLIYLVLPETLVIFGFVIAIILIGQIGG